MCLSIFLVPLLMYICSTRFLICYRIVTVTITPEERNAGWLFGGRLLPGPRTPESGSHRFPHLGGIDITQG